MLIRIQHFRSMRMRIRIQGVDDQKFKPIYSWKDQYFFVQKLQFTNTETSIMDVQATGEALNPQKRTSSTSKHEISSFFKFLWITFALLDPDPADQNQCVSKRMWIQNTEQNILFLCICNYIYIWSWYLFATVIQKSGPVAFTVCRRLLIPSSTAHDIIRSIRLFVRKIFQENRIQS